MVLGEVISNEYKLVMKLALSHKYPIFIIGEIYYNVFIVKITIITY